jgi:hypothetical protein
MKNIGLRNILRKDVHESFMYTLYTRYKTYKIPSTHQPEML